MHIMCTKPAMAGAKCSLAQGPGLGKALEHQDLGDWHVMSRLSSSYFTERTASTQR